MCRTISRMTSWSRVSTRPRSTTRRTSPIPSGAHIAEIEIDPDTGHLEIVNFTAADDFGRIINPMIVAGQVHGGLAQGIGQAVLEGCVYDKETGQLLDRLLQRLRDAARRRFPGIQAVDQHDAVHAQPARRQRLRRGRRDRRTGGDRQRHRRCAVAARRPPCRDAGHAAPSVAHHPAAPDAGGGRVTDPHRRRAGNERGTR